MAYLNPTVNDFKSYFVRDFPYGTDPSTEILDADIGRALTDAGINFNPNFWATQIAYTTGFLLLTAHYLVMNIQASSQGIASQYNWTTASKGVGSVSESYDIPERISANPELAMLAKTQYGAKYLMLILPQLSGQMFISCGGTLP
jgi:hypothetical protein